MARKDVPQNAAVTLATTDCCPQLVPCQVCDVLNFTYRLPFRPVVAVGDQRQVVPVEVTLHYRLTRCSGPLSQGDLLYTTTLLPGEKVRLQSSDRHTRFSFDNETKLAYNNETTSEESYYAAGMAYGMSNLNILDTTNAGSSFSSSSVSGGGGAGIDLGIFSIGGSASAGSYDANSTSTLAHALSQHAESLHQHMEVSTRAAASTSVGEVATRTHTQTESDDQYESASRTFSNPNHCHALTFLFYRINKCQTVKFEIVSIDRRVDDPAAPTSVGSESSETPNGSCHPLQRGAGDGLEPPGGGATSARERGRGTGRRRCDYGSVARPVGGKLRSAGTDPRQYSAGRPATG